MLRASAAAALVAAVAADGESAPTVGALWKEFNTKFGKVHADEKARYEIFRSNVELIRETNAKGLTYKLGVNQFADLTPSEFADEHTGLKRPSKPWGDLPHLGTDDYSGKDLADSVDWVEKGAVTKVKNQGQCGSCWSFSTTGALEGAWKIATGKLKSLSEQQFVDCDHVDEGCNGGLMDHAFSFAKKHALCTEASYSYEGSKGTCQEDDCTVAIPRGGVVGFKDVKPDSPKALMEALMKQPVSIAIEADKSLFQLYKSGVLKGACGSSLDHGVLAVGYGTDDGVKYWRVKNSWGADWGEDGYIRLFRASKKGDGECGILMQASYPVVTDKPGPAPGPSPPPTPPKPSGGSHYESPPCQDDELAVQIEGADGAVCAPSCTDSTCPSDVPSGTTAKPDCALEDASSGDKYCALVCSDMSECPPTADCAMISGDSGVCVYGQTGIEGRKMLRLAATTSASVINV